MKVDCRLCGEENHFFAQWKDRHYQRCKNCLLIELRRVDLPTFAEEKEEYLLHRNDLIDTGYRKFLSQVTDPALVFLQDNRGKDQAILDFGAGSGAAISVILNEHGIHVKNYDPIFHPEEALLDQTYDLILCTEVVEHFHQPMKSWATICSLLNEQGRIYVMTALSDQYFEREDFQQWWYIREKSHVTFYHSKSLEWIADHFGFKLSLLSNRVAVFDK